MPIRPQKAKRAQGQRSSKTKEGPRPKKAQVKSFQKVGLLQYNSPTFWNDFRPKAKEGPRPKKAQGQRRPKAKEGQNGNNESCCLFLPVFLNKICERHNNNTETCIYIKSIFVQS